MICSSFSSSKRKYPCVRSRLATPVGALEGARGSIRQAEPEHRPLRRIGTYGDLAAMAQGDAPREAQAHPGAAFLGGEERHEELLTRRIRQARSIVSDLDV